MQERDRKQEQLVSYSYMAIYYSMLTYGRSRTYNELYIDTQIRAVGTGQASQAMA